MESLESLLDRVDLSKAIEVVRQLEDLLTPLKPRHSVGSSLHGDETYNEAVVKACRLEELLSKRLCSVGELRNVAISPIYRLDDDSWRSILLRAFQGAARLPMKDGINTSIRLSHVSRKWRSVALDTAELWTDRVSDTPRYTSYAQSRPPWNIGPLVIREKSFEAEMMDAFSVRSKGAALRRALYLPGDDARLLHPWKEFRPTKSLISRLSRVQDATRLLQAIPDSADRMEILTLNIADHPSVNGTADDLSGWIDVRELLYTKVPGVQVLDLSGSSLTEIFGNRSHSEVPLGACRKLSLTTSRLSSESLLNVVECSPRLESLKVTVAHSGGLQVPTGFQMAPLFRSLFPSTRTLKAALRELHLTMSWDVIDAVLNRMSAPSLSKLSLLCPGPVPESAYATERFLQASAPPPTHLSIVNLSRGPCSRLLAALPTLTSLSVTPGGGDTTIPKVLTPSEGRWLCPDLETLSYKHWGPGPRVFLSLLTMVRARQGAHELNPTEFKRLRTLKFTPCPVPENERPVVEELALLLGDGLILEGWRFDPEAMAWHWKPDDEDGLLSGHFGQLAFPFPF